MAVQPIGNAGSSLSPAQNPGEGASRVRPGESPRNAPFAPQTDVIDFSKGALDAAVGAPSSSSDSDSGQQAAINAQDELTPDEQQQVQQLKQRDAEVRRHEQAHVSAAGGYARGGANFTYTTGPDGKRYATGGEVSIDTSPERTPQATIAKMETIKHAALAPAQPSSQDRAVYAQAARAETKARQDLAEQQVEKLKAQDTDQSALGRANGTAETKDSRAKDLVSESISGAVAPQSLDIRA